MAREKKAHKIGGFNGKKLASRVFTILFCVLCAACVLLSALTAFVYFSKSPENTLQIFSLKVYSTINDIPDTDIKAGSIIVVKNTDSDEFYTAQSLKENTVLIIPNLGLVLQNDAVWACLTFTTPLMLIFFLVIANEFKKLSILGAEKKLEDKSEIVENEEF